MRIIKRQIEFMTGSDTCCWGTETSLFRFLQMFTAQDIVSVTKMDASNLSMVFAPNFMRCPSMVHTCIHVVDFWSPRKIAFCVAVNNTQLISGSTDDNGEHPERDGICENPDRWSGYGGNGGGSVMRWEVPTQVLGTNGIWGPGGKTFIAIPSQL